MEGKTIEKVLELGDGIVLLKMDDGTYVSAKVIDPEIPADEINEFLGEAKPIKKEEKKEKKEEKATKAEKTTTDDENQDEPLTRKDLKEMKRKTLLKLIEDRSLLVDPDDFEDDDDGLRDAIAEELEIPEEAKGKKEKEEKPEKEGENDDYTWKDLVDMDYNELSELCTENKLDTDPTDYDEDTEEDKLRRAIAKECDIAAPAKKKL